jgi:Sulfotransferase family
MRIIYIASASHSGSTLLDMMLNAHPEIISVGEVLKLNRIKIAKTGRVKPTRCSCGAGTLLQCEFWSRVDEWIRTTHGKSFADLELNDHGSEPREANHVLFSAIAAVSGKKFIVDSSKMPHRLKLLLRCDGLDVYPIHLSRKPAGQIASMIEHHSLMKSILHYEVVQAQIRRTLKSVSHSTVSYEDMVVDPERTLQAMLEPLGLEFHPRQLAWAEQVKHSFAGNHARWQAKSELILDERWKDCLSPVQRGLIELGTILSRLSSPRAT